MIAILKKSASDEAVSHIVSWIEKKGLKTDVSRGENETIIGLVGDTTKIDPFLLESMDVVERVQRVSEPFKRANRKFHPEDSVIDCGHGVKIGGEQFQVIAGPCSVEGENLIRIARRVKAAGATMLRGGAYKPRTSPYAYQGMGPAGLDLLCEASAELDMPIVTEIMDPRDVQVFLDKKIDVMQIGARNAQNFPLLKEVGKTQDPGPSQARHVRHDRRAAHGSRVHHERGQRQRHPVRARHPHLRDPHPQHLRPQRRARAAPPVAPSRRRRPQPRHRLHPLR